MTSFVIDETGTRHSHVHGVSADEWRHTIARVAVLLSKPEQRAEQGLRKIDTGVRCDDPDCKRLNRRLHSERNLPARYQITRNLSPIRPVDPHNDVERRLCNGHPWLSGSYLCESCARVATAKRLIDTWKTSRRAS